ncbi:MAG TPA: glycosyltransferase [Opitutaceae bacterium]|nr:glycosyltransferase [Lacunisphaera sp.]HWA09190.1 glycosyltransferase [Opitutaceae bacterium]
MSAGLSVVTPSYDDLENLCMTLDSLEHELGQNDELVVIDSSEASAKARETVLGRRFACSVKYVWTKPEGVYQAQNAGIRLATKDWVEIINAGDCMCRGARREIREAIKAHPQVDIHVFGGGAFLKGGSSYVFTPSAAGVWPHQSIIVRGSVYEVDGVYDATYRYAADQVYFARARKRRTWKIHPFILTEFLLGGRSSGITVKHLRENYALRRALGAGAARAAATGIVFPVFRYLLERTIGHERVLKLKCLLFGHYRLDIPQRRGREPEIRR